MISPEKLRQMHGCLKRMSKDLAWGYDDERIAIQGRTQGEPPTQPIADTSVVDWQGCQRKRLDGDYMDAVRGGRAGGTTKTV